MKLKDIPRSKFQVLSGILFILILILPLDLLSHQRSESYSKWTVVEIDEDYLVNINFTIRLSNLNKIEPSVSRGWEKKISDYITSSFKTESGCLQTGKSRTLISRENDVFKVSWSLICSKGIEKVTNDAFFDKDSTHSHVARFIFNSNLAFEKLFTAQSRTWKLKESSINENTAENSRFKEYIFLGLKHISTGYDHLAFLFGLLLLNQRFKKLLLAITGFTLGHSLTLSLAVLDYVRPVTGFIEALIGFSIALLGIEFLVRQNKRNPYLRKSLLYFFFSVFIFYFLFLDERNFWGILGLFIFSFSYIILVYRNISSFFSIFIASIFGLIHGFGFGGFLFEAGFSEDNLIKALFGFNLGVELGQLLAMSIFVIFIYGINLIRLRNKEFIQPILASFLITLGTYWFVFRII